MLTVAIISSILLCVFGIASFFYAADDEDGWAVLFGVGHAVSVFLATVFYCLDSATASLACGGLLTATAGALIILQFFCEESVSDEARLSALLMSFTDIICAIAGYLNIYNYFALGVSCAVLSGLALLNIIITCCYGYDWYDGLKFHIPNIIFAIIAATGVIVGFVVDATLEKEVRVETKCVIYKYDNLNSVVAENEETELHFNEDYVMQIEFEWYNLRVLSAEPKDVWIKVTFPSKINGYISEGIEFTEDTADSKAWTYNFQLNTKTDKQFKSGYFIFNYDSASLGPSVMPFEIQIYVPKADDSVAEEEVFKAYKQNYQYDFNKGHYSFSSADCVKDLSVADEGYYRITIPNECKKLIIKLYDTGKKNLYYSETVTVSDKYYSFGIPYILKNKINSSIYERIKEKNENLIIEIMAVGNDNYADTDFEFSYTVE